jgi:hypothetical protein
MGSSTRPQHAKTAPRALRDPTPRTQSRLMLNLGISSAPNTITIEDTHIHTTIPTAASDEAFGLTRDKHDASLPTSPSWRSLIGGL